MERLGERTMHSDFDKRIDPHRKVVAFVPTERTLRWPIPQLLCGCIYRSYHSLSLETLLFVAALLEKKVGHAQEHGIDSG